MTDDRTDDNDRLLRQFERELDCFHKSLPLMKRSPESALYGVMAAYDSIWLPLAAISQQMDEISLGSEQRARVVVQSINPALFWLTSIGTYPVPAPAQDSELINDGGDFLTHARDYFQLSAFHAMYSRGLISVECDQKKRLVRFIQSTGRPFSEGYASAIVARRAPRSQVGTQEQITSALHRWLASVTYRLKEGRIYFDHPSEFTSEELIHATDLSMPREALEVPDDVDLIGFTMKEFRRFWCALYSWSITAIELYLDLAIGGIAQEQCMPTQVVPERQFTEAITSITGLSASVVNEIMNRLTYDASNPKRDVFLQPLLRHCESVCWCPLVIKFSRPERNMLKLMSRSARLSGAAANIIGGRETQMLSELGLFLSDRAGYDYKINTTIRWNGQTSEIDLLAYNKRAPTEILLVEAKAVLAVDDVAEVHSANEHMRKAERQLKRGIDILKSMPLERKGVLFRFVNWDQIEVYRLLVITPDSSPLDENPHEDISVITLELLRTRLRNRDLKTPTTPWEACQQKAWLKPFDLNGEDYYLSIKVGSITYDLPATRKKSC